MPSKIKKILSSDRAKRIFVLFALLAVLFIIVNDFVMPWYVNRNEILDVKSVVGLRLEDAVKVLDSLGLEGVKGYTRQDRSRAIGTVIIQNPLAGSKVKKGRRIYLTVSGGEQLVKVPSIKGRTLRDAKFGLEREGLKLGNVEYQPSAEFPANTIIEQKLLPGISVKKDVYVSVIVSQGNAAQQVVVPELTGKTLNDAGKILANSGLKIGNVSYITSSDLLPNTVVDQFPRIGESVPYGQTVDLFIVQGGEKKKPNIDNY
jgi:beta-lactam-binding protein with PASTA domain